MGDSSPNVPTPLVLSLEGPSYPGGNTLSAIVPHTFAALINRPVIPDRIEALPYRPVCAIISLMGKLYVVGTPIGNLEDLTLRAIRVLGEVSLIAAEDTRVTRKLLNHLDLRTPSTSCHQHNWRHKLPALLAALELGDVALVTDAGMPGVSDPGSEVIAQAAAAGFDVEVIPGVSAVTAGLSLSGLGGDAFLFLGFLPRRGKERRARLEQAALSSEPLVLFESPYRLAATLAELRTALGNRRVAVGRELTKRHEEMFRGSLEEAVAHFTTPRGEFVLVIEGTGQTASAAGRKSDEPEAVTHAALSQELARLRQAGVRAKEAVAQVAVSSGLPKRQVYQLWLDTAPSHRSSPSSTEAGPGTGPEAPKGFPNPGG